jgi:hypothetical protein
MRNTLQEQYNLIKEGKGAKDVFLKHAKTLFPEYIPNSMGFEPTVVILKQKSILKEASSYKEVVKQKDTFEADFKKFLVEAKKVKEASIKSDLKKTDKSVDKVNDEANYDNTDTKSADNVIFDQYVRGIYIEMSKDSKQDLDKVKEKVLKNLTKDPIYYVKNGQFGIDGVGYSDELPGAKTAKDDKTIVLDKSKPKSNVKDTLGKKESAKGAPKKVKEMSTTAKNSKGVKKMAPPTKGKIIKLKENQSLEDLMNEIDNVDEGMDSRDPLFVQGYEAFYSADEKKNPYEGDEDASKAEKWEDGWCEAERAAHDEADNDDLQEGQDVKVLDDSKYIESLAKKLCDDKEFADGTGFYNQPQKLIAKYSSEDIKEFYKEIFGELPLGDPSNFSVNEAGGLNERLTNIIKKVFEGGMEDADAQLAKQEADAEAKAAALSKQRADNKAKIAAANKNI